VPLAAAGGPPPAGALVAGDGALLALRANASAALDAYSGALVASDRALIDFARTAAESRARNEDAVGRSVDAGDAGDAAGMAAAEADADRAWAAYQAALFAMARIPAEDLAGLAAKASFARQVVEDGASPAEAAVMASLCDDAARFLAAVPAGSAEARA